MNWKLILAGVAVGAVAGWMMGVHGKGGNPLGITGRFGAPYQNRIDNGR